jgi:hypothetical protein
MWLNQLGFQSPLRVNPSGRHATGVHIQLLLGRSLRGGWFLRSCSSAFRKVGSASMSIDSHDTRRCLAGASAWPVGIRGLLRSSRQRYTTPTIVAEATKWHAISFIVTHTNWPGRCPAGHGSVGKPQGPESLVLHVVQPTLQWHTSTMLNVGLTPLL